MNLSPGRIVVAWLATLLVCLLDLAASAPQSGTAFADSSNAVHVHAVPTRTSGDSMIEAAASQPPNAPTTGIGNRSAGTGANVLPKGLNVVGAIIEYAFDNLIPFARSEALSSIQIEGVNVVAAGRQTSVTVISANLDLSTVTREQVGFSTPEEFSDIIVSEQSRTRVRLSFMVAPQARGERTLSITVGGVSRSAAFRVLPPLSISVSPTRISPNSTGTLAVTSVGAFDLSQVDVKQISFNPPGSVSNVAISDRTATSLRLTFFASGTQVRRSLTITVNNVSVPARFEVRQPFGCSIGFVCCGTDSNGDCSSCRGLSKKNICPKGQRCCDEDVCNPVDQCPSGCQTGQCK